MARRKKPPTSSRFSGEGFKNPSAWQSGFIAYLEAECGMSPNTVMAYRRDREKFLNWNQQNARRTVHQVDIPTMTSFLDHLQQQGLAASSIGRNLVVVRMFFRYLMLESVVAESVVDLISSPKLWRRLPKVLSPEMVEQMKADLAQISEMTPTMNDGGKTAVFVLAGGEMTYGRGKINPPDRTSRFQLVEGSWRLYDNSTAIRKEISGQSALAPPEFEAR